MTAGLALSATLRTFFFASLRDTSFRTPTPGPSPRGGVVHLSPVIASEAMQSRVARVLLWIAGWPLASFASTPGPSQ